VEPGKKGVGRAAGLLQERSILQWVLRWRARGWPARQRSTVVAVALTGGASARGLTKGWSRRCWETLYDFRMAMSDARGQIALSMIVRDEEDVLGRCLASARDWDGEVIVVDTGSRDRSVAIAESFGARVIPFTWCDDFSAARNASLEAASLPWALVLDADEELVVEDASAFERAVTARGPAGFSLTLNNQLEQGLSGDFRVFRFFRRDMEGMRYRGQLHEQIVAVAEKRVATAHLRGIRILHHGHTAQRVAQKQKGARNVRLAHALVATRPEDPFAWFSLAREQGPESMSSYRRALELLGASGQGESRDDWVLHLYVDFCTALRREGQNSEAEDIAERGLVLFPHSPDLRFARGQTRLAKGDAAGAAAIRRTNRL